MGWCEAGEGEVRGNKMVCALFFSVFLFFQFACCR